MPEVWREVNLIIKTRKIVSGYRIILVVPKEVETHLSKSCFRDTKLPVAGNFFRWSSTTELFHTELVTDALLKDVEKRIQARTHKGRLMISFDTQVGWSGTDFRSSYPDQYDLEEFRPNLASTALRVKPNNSIRYHLAPMTNYLTIAYDIETSTQAKELVVIIQTIYPGIDIGILQGDITEREGRVFFDWNHPGFPR